MAELPDFITILAAKFKENVFVEYLHLWEYMVFSLIIIFVLSLTAYLATRKTRIIPGRLQNALEMLVEGLDNFVCGILGSRGRKYTPFIGTLFIYIFAMNVSGLIPFVKAPTGSWSITLALAVCVFVYVQYTAIRELGFLKYIDHLSGKPRGILKLSVVLPLLIFSLHLLAEFIRPLSLSLRLRSNIWGDEVLLAVLAGFGIKGLPLLFFNMLAALLTALVQTVVFCLLSTIYFALVLNEEEIKEGYCLK